MLQQIQRIINRIKSFFNKNTGQGFLQEQQTMFTRDINFSDVYMVSRMLTDSSIDKVMAVVEEIQKLSKSKQKNESKQFELVLKLIRLFINETSEAKFYEIMNSFLLDKENKYENYDLGTQMKILKEITQKEGFSHFFTQLVNITKTVMK